MLSCVEWLGVGSGGWIGVSCFRDIHPHIARRPREGGEYAAAYRLNHCCLWNTGSSAFADDDSQGMMQPHDIGVCHRSPRRGNHVMRPRAQTG